MTRFLWHLIEWSTFETITFSLFLHHLSVSPVLIHKWYEKTVNATKMSICEEKNHTKINEWVKLNKMNYESSHGFSSVHETLELATFVKFNFVQPSFTFQTRHWSCKHHVNHVTKINGLSLIGHLLLFLMDNLRDMWSRFAVLPYIFIPAPSGWRVGTSHYCAAEVVTHSAKWFAWGQRSE